MISRHKVYMDGVELSSLHNEIAVKDIEYPPVSAENATARKAVGNGAYLTNRYHGPISVSIIFELHVYSTVERQRAMQRIASWAQGRILQTSDRPGQRLVCVCTQPPSIESAQRWNDDLGMTFTAYEIPYWQEVTPNIATLTGSGATGTLFVPGNAGKTFVDAEITAAAAVTTLTLTVADTSITLSGLSIPSGGKVTLTHDNYGILHIQYGNTSLLNKRTGSDDLIATCGKLNAISCTGGNVTCKFSSRGGWL